MVQGSNLKIMQCHSTPDDAPGVCIGFARRHPDTIGMRFAQALGLVSLAEVGGATPSLDDLHTVYSLLKTHGAGTGPCASRCLGCVSKKCGPFADPELTLTGVMEVDRAAAKPERTGTRLTTRAPNE